MTEKQLSGGYIGLKPTTDCHVSLTLSTFSIAGLNKSPNISRQAPLIKKVNLHRSG